MKFPIDTPFKYGPQADMALARPRVDIFTDGACRGNPGPGAWAAVLLCGPKTKHIRGFVQHGTNNQMELTAAYFALSALKQPCRVALHSDSEYLVKTMNGEYSRNANGDYWGYLEEMCAEHDVIWNWISRDYPLIHQAHNYAEELLRARGF